MIQKWNVQEIECYKNKKHGGCKFCPVFYAYKIKNCKMFSHILKKIALFGEPN